MIYKRAIKVFRKTVIRPLISKPNFSVDSGSINSVIWQATSPDLRIKLKESIFKPVVLGGDWDREKSDFDDTTLHKSFVKHFVDGQSWVRTQYYYDLQEGRLEQRVIEQGGVENLLEKYEKLYDSMCLNGFDDNFPIHILIGRNGEYIRWDGAHRLSISKIIGIKKIPVRVLIVHSDMSHLIKIRMLNWVESPRI